MSREPGAWTVARLLAVTSDYLAGKGSTSPRLDAELLLAEALGMERVSLYLDPERPLQETELSVFREFVRRRAEHEPVAYILGRASFRYLTLNVASAVLVPRPETEELVDWVLDWLRERPLPPGGVDAVQQPLVVDVGTGSGAIALSLASEGGVTVLATDVSEAALAVARENAVACGLAGQVVFKHVDLLDGCAAGRFRIAVANPPYLSVDELAGVHPDVRLHEPEGALLAGRDGLDLIRRLLPQAYEALGPGGALFVEVGENQAANVGLLAREAGFVHVEVHRDLSGKERMVRTVRPGALRLSFSLIPPSFVDTLRSALGRGAILGLPTDTVYGLASAWDSGLGVRRLFEAKGRAEEKVLAAVFSSVEQVRACLPGLDETSVRVLSALLPGPFTFVVATQVECPPLVGSEDSLGVRVPDRPSLLRFLTVLGIPLALTSANPSGQADPARLSDVDEGVLAHCACALDDDEAAAGVASTVVDLRPLAHGGKAVVLREGSVPAAEVSARIDALVF